VKRLHAWDECENPGMILPIKKRISTEGEIDKMVALFVRKTPFYESCLRHLIMSTVTANIFTLTEGGLLIFLNLWLKNCTHGIERTTLALCSQPLTAMAPLKKQFNVDSIFSSFIAFLLFFISYIYLL